MGQSVFVIQIAKTDLKSVKIPIFKVLITVVVW